MSHATSACCSSSAPKRLAAMAARRPGKALHLRWDYYYYTLDDYIKALQAFSSYSAERVRVRVRVRPTFSSYSAESITANATSEETPCERCVAQAWASPRLPIRVRVTVRVRVRVRGRVRVRVRP